MRAIKQWLTEGAVAYITTYAALDYVTLIWTVNNRFTSRAITDLTAIFI